MFALGAVEWGSVGEWVSGIGGLAAAGVALWVAVSAMQVRGEEHRQLVQYQHGTISARTRLRLERKDGVASLLTDERIQDVRVHILDNETTRAYCYQHGAPVDSMGGLVLAVQLEPRRGFVLDTAGSRFLWGATFVDVHGCQWGLKGDGIPSVVDKNWQPFPQVQSRTAISPPEILVRTHKQR